MLRHAALSQLPDGRLLATFPTDRGPEDCHYVIEDYSCQWFEALKLYHDVTGDKAFVREMWPTLVDSFSGFLSAALPADFCWLANTPRSTIPSPTFRARGQRSMPFSTRRCVRLLHWPGCGRAPERKNIRSGRRRTQEGIQQRALE